MKSYQPSETYRRLHCDIIEELAEQICTQCENYYMRYITGSEKTAIVMEKKFDEYKKRTSLNLSSNRLDRHKLASCICGTIIEVRPLEGRKGTETKKAANEMLALYSALSVVKIYMIDDLAKKLGIPQEENGGAVSYMYENFEMLLPPLEENIRDVQNYERNLLNALYWSHSECKRFKTECFQYDVWAYAKIFYHLERYNKKYFDDTYNEYIKSQGKT